MHVILAPVHAILLCVIQARNSSNYVRHPYAGALLSSARADVEIFLRRHCRRRSKKLTRAQANVPSSFQSTARDSIRLSHAVVHHRSSTISCNSLVETAHTKKKKRRVISGTMLLEKGKHDMSSLCTCPSVDPSLVHVIASHFAPGPC